MNQNFGENLFDKLLAAAWTFISVWSMYWPDLSGKQENGFGYRFYSIGVFCSVKELFESCFFVREIISLRNGKGKCCISGLVGYTRGKRSDHSSCNSPFLNIQAAILRFVNFFNIDLDT